MQSIHDAFKNNFPNDFKNTSIQYLCEIGNIFLEMLFSRINAPVIGITLVIEHWKTKPYKRTKIMHGYVNIGFALIC